MSNSTQTSHEAGSIKAAKTSQEVRDHVRHELVPLALRVYKLQLMSDDDRVAKAAADSVMKIEGTLQNAAAGQVGTGERLALNLDFGSMLDAVRQITGGTVRQVQALAPAQEITDAEDPIRFRPAHAAPADAGDTHE